MCPRKSPSSCSWCFFISNHRLFYNRFTIINMQGMFQEIFSQENILNKYLRLFTVGKIPLSCKQMVTYVCAIPGWVAFPFSRGSSQPRNQTEVSCIAGEFFTNWAIKEAVYIYIYIYIYIHTHTHTQKYICNCVCIYLYFALLFLKLIHVYNRKIHFYYSFVYLHLWEESNKSLYYGIIWPVLDEWTFLPEK